ncbi:MAG: hypothetical protein GY754_39225 [bacterium]|nr:hypothetical protein [bacterium]
MRYALTIMLIIQTLLAGSCFSGKKPPAAQKGVLHLEDWDFEKHGPVKLNGEWEFYWKQLLTNEDFAGEDRPVKSGFITVPGIWNGYEIDEKKISGDGYATYRLLVLIKNPKEALIIQFLPFSTACTVYVNGKKIHYSGVVDKTRETMVPAFSPGFSNITPEKNQLEIIFHVSNFHHKKGGAWNVCTVGTKKDIHKTRERRIYFDFLLLGSILIMGFYHLGLFSLRKDEKSTLYFGLFCLLVVVRILTTGEYYLTTFFPGIHWELLIKIEYLSFSLAAPILILFLYQLFPWEIPKRILYIIIIPELILFVFILFTPAKIYTHILSVYQAIIVFSMLYGIYFVSLAVIRKRDGVEIFLAGFFVFLLTIINDILFSHNIISTDFLVPFGIFVFILSQSFLISRRFSTAFTKVENLTEKLDIKSIEVEKKNIQLLKMDILKDQFLSNISHEMKTPLSVVYGYAELMCDEEERDVDTLKSYSEDIFKESKNLTATIDNLILVTGIEANPTLEIGPVDLSDTVKQSLEYHSGIISRKEIIVENEISSGISLQGDPHYIRKVVDNIIKNAVIFNREKGTIHISGQETANTIQLCIKDTGIGIPETKQEEIWKKFFRVDPSLTSRSGGVGIGLFLARKIMELHGGTISVMSDPKRGSLFIITAPRKKP